jgi:hypothetical protein
MAEVIGWIASGLVIASLMATSIVRLRIMGLGATAAFMTYGVLIEAWPIVITNVIVAVIHLWYLRGLLSIEEFFDVLPVAPTSAYLAYFCEFHGEDVRRFMPGFTYEPADDQMAVFILRNMIPAGVFIGIPAGETIEVRLDYVIPRYRDFKVGRFLYSPASGVFSERSIRSAWTRAETPRHRAYLKRMGFREEADRWVLDLVDDG